MKFLQNIPVLIIIAIFFLFWWVLATFASGPPLNQFLIGISLALASVVCLMALNMTDSKFWWRFNLGCIIFFFCTGGWLLYDLRHRPIQYMPNTIPSYLTICNQRNILEVDGEVYQCSKDSIKYSTTDSLKLYIAYKVDMFGYNTFPQLCVRSGLMDHYYYPQILVKN